MTRAQRTHLGRLQAGQTIECWHDAGSYRWHYRRGDGVPHQHDSERPHWKTVESLMRLGWVAMQRGREGRQAKFRHRNGYKRRIITFTITLKGRRALTLDRRAA